jgi:hypothetical protein
MPDALEQPVSVRIREAPPTSQRRRWRNSRTGGWIRSDEAQGSNLWDLLSSSSGKRKAVATDFASALGAIDGVVAVWLLDLKDDLEVAAILQDPEVEDEIRDVFIDLVCERLDASEGELLVYLADEVPGRIELGEQLV